MAGEWIKMRADLLTSPKVVRISSALKTDRLRVIGGLMAVWCLFDIHSEDGVLNGYNLDALDGLVGWPGFGRAMERVEWLVVSGDSLSVPRFDEHNGQSAKRRAQEAQRKRTLRGQTSASDADKKADKVRTREEKKSLPKGKEGARKKGDKKTTLPADFAVSERVSSWAKEKGFGQLPAYLEFFISKARAKGYTYVDWDEGLMGCVREDWPKLRQGQVNGQPASKAASHVPFEPELPAKRAPMPPDFALKLAAKMRGE
jgi:hypothetical protein